MATFSATGFAFTKPDGGIRPVACGVAKKLDQGPRARSARVAHGTSTLHHPKRQHALAWPTMIQVLYLDLKHVLALLGLIVSDSDSSKLTLLQVKRALYIEGAAPRCLTLGAPRVPRRRRRRRGAAQRPAASPRPRPRRCRSPARTRGGLGRDKQERGGASEELVDGVGPAAGCRRRLGC
jgi:hypothetical protein